MNRVFTDFRLGIGFLTLIPVGDVGKADLGRALYTFPWVGLLIGAATVAAGAGSQFLFADPIHAVAVLLSATLLTGGLHLDGLSDTFDGICSWRSPEEKVKIMKDSRVGVMGVLALIFVLSVKFTCLVSLGSYWWIGALLAPVWGRWSAFYCLHFFPRLDSGIASQTSGGTRNQFIFASIATLAFSGVAFFFGGISMVKLCLLPVLLAPAIHLFIGKINRSLGGINGDICGAVSELTEAALLLILSLHFMGLVE